MHPESSLEWLIPMSAPLYLESVIDRHPEFPAFVQWLRGRSRKTLRESTLTNYLRQLLSMESVFDLDLDDPVPQIPGMINEMVRRGLSAQTITMRSVFIRLWCEFRGFELDDDIKEMLKAKHGKRKRRIHPKDILTFEELMDIATNTRNTAARAFYMVLYDTGARPGAVCNLDVRDVEQDRHGFVLQFRKTKNEQSKRAVRLLTPQANQFLSQWWSIHPRRNQPGAPLFINQRGGRFKVNAMTSLLKQQHQERLGRGEGRGKAPLNLYLFRKSRATRLLKEDRLKPIELKRRMGHSKHSNMLEKYYAILDEEDQASAELRYLGVEERAESETPQPTSCPNCGALNDPGKQQCYRCGFALTEEEAIRQQERTVQRTLDRLRESGALQEIVSEAVSEALKQRPGQEA